MLEENNKRGFLLKEPLKHAITYFAVDETTIDLV